MHIFRFPQKCLIAFKPRLWLGHSRTFTELSISHCCCVLSVIVLLEVEPSAQSEVLNALDLVFIKAQYFGALSFSSTLTSPSVSATEKQPHSMRRLPAHFTFGMVLCRCHHCLVSHQTWCLELRFIKPENLFSQNLRVLWVFYLQITSFFSCVFMCNRH